MEYREWMASVSHELPRHLWDVPCRRKPRDRYICGVRLVGMAASKENRDWHRQLHEHFQLDNALEGVPVLLVGERVPSDPYGCKAYAVPGGTSCRRAIPLFFLPKIRAANTHGLLVETGLMEVAAQYESTGGVLTWVVGQVAYFDERTCWVDLFIPHDTEVANFVIGRQWSPDQIDEFAALWKRAWESREMVTGKRFLFSPEELQDMQAARADRAEIERGCPCE